MTCEKVEMTDDDADCDVRVLLIKGRSPQGPDGRTTQENFLILRF